MNETVSVVIPAYNNADFLAACIESVQAQTYKDWELFVIDDASTDDSHAVASVYAAIDPRIKAVTLARNSGNPARPRNTGIAMATGRYIAFLDADDMWMAHKLEKQVSFMRNGDKAFSFTRLQIISPDGDHKRFSPRPPAKVDYNEYIRNTCIPPSSVMIDKRQLPDFRFVEDLKRHEDFVTFVNALKTVDAYGMDEALVRYRRGHESLSSNIAKAAVTQIFNYTTIARDIGVLPAARAFTGYAVRALSKRLPSSGSQPPRPKRKALH